MSIADKAIKVEFMLAGWGQTHTGGSKITFWVSDEDLEHFKHLTVKKGNTAGQRFMAALVEVGDDDQPKDRDKPRDPLRMSAVMLCKESDFQAYAAEATANEARVMGLPPEEVAKWVVLDHCRIPSRKELDHNANAANAFARLMEMYRDWRKEQGLQ